MDDEEPPFINPVPLIPPLEKPTCPDTSHVIREEFQKIIGADEFPETVAQNLANNQIENEHLLNCGLEALNTSKEWKGTDEEITKAELCLMESQAIYLVKSAYKEINKNTFGKIYPPIDPEIIEKFSLLNIDKICPNIYRRILNNKLSPFSFIYKDPCPVTDALETLAFCCGTPNRNLTDQQKMQIKALERSDRFADLKLIDFPGLRSKYFNQMVFQVYPKKIVFRNFELFRIYEKKLVLKNITTHLQHIIIPRIPKTSLFYIYPNKMDPRVAPGMYFSFTVGFRAELVENSHEHVVIQIIGSKPIHIDIYSYKDMPFLKGLVYHKEFMNETVSITKVTNNIYNYTIDCGTVLYGCRSECNFIVQNTGGLSRFFLISEHDWHNRRITCLTDTYKLILPDFKIYPAYFLLHKNEICELKFEFCPTEEGLLLDKLFLVSDNNNVEEIDVFGDCIYYEPDFFRFEMPECPSTPFKSEGEVKNVLHMGAIYYEQTIIAHFYMYNRSLISIPFECRMEEIAGTKNCRSIHKEWVLITPECGTILPLSKERLEVCVKMRSKEIGLYKFNLNIFAIDIPEMSLVEGPIFTFGEEYRSKDLKQKLLTVLADRIEVQIHHIKIPVCVYPDVIVFPKLIYKTLGTMSQIQVVNEGFCCLYFNWIQKERNNKKVKIKVKPNKFKIASMQSVSCSVFVKLKTYDDFEETLTLNVNNGFFEKHIPVIGKVEKPRMKVTKTFINFGDVKIHSQVENVFTITNISETCLCWEVKEFQYDYQIHQFVETDNSSLSQISGELCQNNNETKVVYELDTTVQRKFFSILIFFTIYKYEKYESTHVILLGYIHEPKIRIDAMCNGEEIFKIENIFYVNESITKTFELHNDSIVDANYNWGAPSGYHTKHLNFAFDYNKGVLYPNSRKYVDITLILKKPGIIFDFYIPCYIEYMHEPLILQILCVIKKPQVIFYIPAIPDITEIVWPADFEAVSEASDEATVQTVQYYDDQSQSKSMDFGDTLSTVSTSVPKVQQSTGTVDWNLNNIFEYLHQFEMTGEQSIISATTESIKASTATIQSEFGLCSKFASETSICEYVVYFFNVKCKEVSTKTFKIKNPMTYPLKYSISIKHFKTKEFKRKRLEDLYINLNWKTDDSNSKQLSDYGILVTVEPSSGVLTANSETTYTITVYAETWGFYLEEISIEIEQIPTFYMNLVIQIVGQPIEMPMISNTEGFIQFNNIQKCTFDQKRRVSLYNNSTIPCIIVWHVFLKTKIIEYDANITPFNVLIDFCGFESDPQIFGSVKIIKYVGKEILSDFNLFRVEPKELYLEPKQTRQITVFFKPTLYEQIELDISNIRASLVGSIYIEEKNRNSNFVIRNPNKDLQLINIAIKTAISFASLNLDCIRGETDIIININDILNGEIKSKTMRLVFKNNCKSDIVVNMNVTEPFELISLRSKIGEKNILYKASIRTPVLSNGYLEATIKCEIINEYLLNIADVLYKKVNHYLKGTEIIKENCVKISRVLKIKHQCSDSQTLPISVKLYFPLIQVSTMNLDFGVVCLNSKRHMTLKILNKTASKTWIKILFLKNEKVLKADHSEAFLEPHTVWPKSLYLTITFTPSTNTPIQDTIRIETKLPQYYIDVNVTGTGSYDEKYFYESIHDYKCFKLK